MYNLPLRFTILHFEQRVRIEEDTFIVTFPYSFRFPYRHLVQPKFPLYLPIALSSRPNFFPTPTQSG